MRQCPALIVRLSDDSPEDGVGGALLLRERIFINGVEHPEIDPIIEGGVAREGLLEASGSNTVTLTYNIETDFRPAPGRKSPISGRSSASRWGWSWPTTTS